MTEDTCICEIPWTGGCSNCEHLFDSGPRYIVTLTYQAEVSASSEEEAIEAAKDSCILSATWESLDVASVEEVTD